MAFLQSFPSLFRLMTWYKNLLHLWNHWVLLLKFQDSKLNGHQLLNLAIYVLFHFSCINNISGFTDLTKNRVKRQQTSQSITPGSSTCSVLQITTITTCHCSTGELTHGHRPTPNIASKWLLSACTSIRWSLVEQIRESMVSWSIQWCKR